MNPDFPIIETKRLKLRQFNDLDLNQVFMGLSHPDVIKYYGISFKTLEDTKVQMQWFNKLEEEGKGIWWAICDKTNEAFIGACGLYEIEKTNRKAEIGFWLLPDFWKQGFVNEAIPHICQYGFNTLQLHRIEGFVDSNNQSCKKTLSRLKFEYEGTMVDCEWKDGNSISLDIFALINNKH